MAKTKETPCLIYCDGKPVTYRLIVMLAVSDLEMLTLDKMSIPRDGGYSHAQWVYRHVAKGLQGKCVPVLLYYDADGEGNPVGAASSAWAAIPEELRRYRKRPIESPMIHLDPLWLNEIGEEVLEGFQLPYVDYPDSAWWEVVGLKKLPVLTTWVDGFVHLVPVEALKMLGQFRESDEKESSVE